jgi:hypothetical protein
LFIKKQALVLEDARVAAWYTKLCAELNAAKSCAGLMRLFLDPHRADIEVNYTKLLTDEMAQGKVEQFLEDRENELRQSYGLETN